MKKNDIMEFKKDVIAAFNSAYTLSDIQEEITYLLGYMCYINCKLENNPYPNFLIEKIDNTFGNLVDSFSDTLKKAKNSKILTYEAKKYIEETFNYLEKHSYLKINVNYLLELLKKHDIYFYEKMLKTNFPNNGYSKYGTISTPDELIEIINYLSNDSSKIFDIGCGLGNSLVYLKVNNYNASCSGIEINYLQWLISSIRMSVFYNKGNVIYGDYLNTIINNKYSLMICNMPFGLKMNRIHRDEILRNFNEILDIKFNPASSMEWLLAYKSLSNLTSNGKLILISPHPPLFKDADVNLRKNLVNRNLIEYVIELPEGTLFGTKLPYSMVVINNKKENKNIKFVDASKCIKISGIIKKIDYKKVISMLNGDSIREINLDEVAENDYSLLPSKYFNNEKKTPLVNATKLSDLKVEVLRGFQFFTKNDAIENGEYSIATIGDIDDFGNLSNSLLRLNTPKDVSKFILKENDIIISNKGTKIKICYVEKLKDKKTLFHGNLSVIRCNDSRLNPMFLKIYLESKRGQLELNSIQTGTVIITINLNKLSNIKIPLLDIDAQNKIVANYIFKKKELDILEMKINELKSSLTDNINSIFSGSDISE